MQVTVLSDQLVTALRDAILRGDFPPGHRLVEAEIAQQMGVSRAPVREAIRHLNQEGLVEIFRHRGAVVVGVSEEEIDAVYEVRAAIEAVAFEQACGRMIPERLAELRALVEDMARHIERREVAELIEKDISFHRIVLDVSGYRVLGRVWDSLDGIMRVRVLQEVARPTPAAKKMLDRTADMHLELLEALEQNDPARARQIVREHITGATQLVGGDGRV